MKRSICLVTFCLVWVGIAPLLWAAPQSFKAASSDSQSVGARFSAFIQTGAERDQQVVISPSDLLSIDFEIRPAPGDIGRMTSLFLVAWHNDQAYMKNAEGRWIPWNRKWEDLAAFDTRTLADEEPVTVLADEGLPAGEYQIYAGYRNTRQAVVFNNQPLSFAVFGDQGEGMHRLRGGAMLENYLKAGMSRSGAGDLYRDEVYVIDSPFWTVTADAAGKAVSTTNIQEKGVDEADLIKTDGRVLYRLGQCDEGQDLLCLSAGEMREEPASVAELGRLKLETSVDMGGLYLLTGRPDGEPDILVRVGGSGGNYWGSWRNIWWWQAKTTEVDIIDVSQPDSMELLTSLEIEGSLVSSRRIGETLYLVSRYTPSLEGLTPYPHSEEQKEANLAALAEGRLEQLLPRVQMGEEPSMDLVDPARCWLPPYPPEIEPEPTMITISAIPLANPEEFQSTTFVGSSETIYVSLDSIYLATSRQPYHLLAEPAVMEAAETAEPTTELHKFALDEGGVEYRGSGEVSGHLGWEADKKPFRMGEYDGILRIATSVLQWGGAGTALPPLLFLFCARMQIPAAWKWLAA